MTVKTWRERVRPPVSVDSTYDAMQSEIDELRAALATAPVIDTCDLGHKFAKLPDHPTRNGLARCPHCLVLGLATARAEEREGGA